MTTIIGAAAFAFVVLVIIATQVTKRSLAALTADEKARLVDTAAQTPIWWSLLLLALLGIWFAATMSLRGQVAIITTGALIAMLILSTTAMYMTYGRLKRGGLPDAFLRSFLLARGLRLAGALALFSTMAASLFTMRR
jgi:hypothetical protein